MKCLRMAKSVALAMVLLAASQITFAQSDQSAGNPTTSLKDFHAPAGHPERDHANRHEDRKKKFAQELNLTQEQQVQIEALHQAFHKTHHPEMEVHRAQFEEIRKLM